MEKIRAIYILLIGILISMLVIGGGIIFSSFGSTNSTAPPSSISCIKIEDRGYFMRIYLTNPKDRDLNYTYFFLEDGKPMYNEDNEQIIHRFFMPKGSNYYSGHFQYMDAEQIHDVTLLVYREGEAEPIENTTCNFAKLH